MQERMHCYIQMCQGCFKVHYTFLLLWECERQTYGGVVHLIIETDYFSSRRNISSDCAIDLIQVPMYSLKQERSFGTTFRYI